MFSYHFDLQYLTNVTNATQGCKCKGLATIEWQQSKGRGSLAAKSENKTKL